MKHRHLFPLSLLTALAALVLPSHADLVRSAPASEIVPTSKVTVPAPVSDAEKAKAIVQMEAEQKRIVSRLKISAPMEVENFNGVDPVMEAYELGFIVEATLEQVEAAIAAAAKTPGTEDDLAAEELRHRGSYRFFAPDAEKATSATTKP